MSIIGISGKIGSGKNTVADIIQYLCYKKYVNGQGQELETTFREFQKFPERKKHNLSQWQIKMFAGKIKDIVCLLIGCTREQLEDREFKEKPLGEEWVKYRLPDPYAEKHEYLWYNSIDELGKDNERYNKDNYILDNIIKEEITPRKMMQLLGTECGREIIHPNIWVNALFADYKAYKSTPLMQADPIKYDDYYPNEYPDWIIPDTRFPNEIERIDKLGGLKIRVERDRDKRLPELKGKTVSTKELHSSETSLDDYGDWDYVIYNNYSMETLIQSVKEILEDEDII